MGSSHSVYTSRPKDTAKNLLWAVEESLNWEEQVPECKKLLTDPYVDEQRSKLGGLDLIHFEIDQGRQLFVQCREILLSKAGGKKYLEELEKEKLSIHAEAALGKTASDVFAEGAAVKVATDPAVATPLLSTSAATQTTDHTNLEENKAASPTEWTISKANYTPEKRAVISEFLFIHSLIEKCILNCQFCYKLYLKSLRLHHDLSKHKKQWTANHVDLVTKELQRTEKLLTDSLANFDRARRTLLWAHRDYELSVGLLKLEQQIKRLIRCNTAAHKLVSPTSQLCLSLDELLNDLNKLKSQYYSAIHKNDKEAINLGFNYLDADENNKLSIADLNEMSPRVRQLLGTTDKKQLTNKHLHTVFDQQVNTIKDLVERTKQLEMKNAELKAEGLAVNDALIAKQQQEINSLIDRTIRACDDLHELYTFFLQAFARNVFAELNTEDLQHSAELEAKTLTAGLASLDINKQQDPLATKEASVNAVKELIKEDPQQLATHHAKEYHTPLTTEACDKEGPVYT